MDVMIDLETLSTRPNARILIIAAVKFNRTGVITTEARAEIPQDADTFYRRVDMTGHVDQNTINWWNKQHPDIYNEAFKGVRTPLATALCDFITWFGNSQVVWSHGATFDIVILSEAFHSLNMTPPWKYWNCRDTRTLYDIAGVRNSELPQVNKHHALYDCIRQIWGVKTSMKRLDKTNW